MSRALHTGPKTRPKLAYLSGPMTGLPNMNFPAFNAAADKLRRHGLKVVNPAELALTGGSWQDCMRADIKALCDCDTIVLLPGWENSNGANLELHLAHRLGLAILFLDALVEDLELAELVDAVAPVSTHLQADAAPMAVFVADPVLKGGLV